MVESVADLADDAVVDDGPLVDLDRDLDPLAVPAERDHVAGVGAVELRQIGAAEDDRVGSAAGDAELGGRRSGGDQRREEGSGGSHC